MTNSTMTRKEIAARAHMSVDTFVARHEKYLEKARCRAIERPKTFFTAAASRILQRRHVISEPLED